jgi:transcription-repair coupling factor (superfamily II helicase)
MSITLEELKHLFQKSEKVKTIVSNVQTLEAPKIALSNLRGSGESFIASALVEELKGVHLFIVNDKEQAAYLYNDFQSILGEQNVLFFPSSYRFPYQEEKVDNSNILLRAETLENLSRRKTKTLVITYPEAITEKVVTKKHLKKNTLEIKKGDLLDLGFIIDLLVELEFERTDFVYQPGQFSIRGGIVDIFSFANEFPYRVELFGDEVESIRSFDPASQLSIKPMGRVNILPNVQASMLKEHRESFIEFLTPATTIWAQDLDFTIAKVGQEFIHASEAYQKLSSTINQLSPEELYVSGIRLKELLLLHPVFDTSGKNQLKSEYNYTFNHQLQPSFNKNFDILSTNLADNEKAGFKTVIVANSPKQIDRIHRVFDDINAELDFTTLQLNIHSGFIDKDLKMVIYTDHQIFERYHRFRLKEGFTKTKQAITIKELTNLQKGDFVTHIDHGVGRFDGLEKIDVNGKQQEAIRLIYRDGDLLYVSIQSLHRIAKYTGKDGTPPSINKLGSQAWGNLKKKTKKKVKEIAFDLIKLYAKRKAQKGFQFAPDTYLQLELEGSFIYEDTPDQTKATNDVKLDMEAETSMDRLVCGDVGFGKTEVAIRAAFKAVTDGKQVAVLVPTTILALQHFKTFSARLKDFPCNVDYINRFKSKKQQTETLKRLANGDVDILVGTHRIVGKDIKFKDLGLLIIDEEQKFGVGVKEKLKTLKANVDTLTLTATPIPRTLQFSLMKARDLSIINTPPPNRHPVQTEIKPFAEDVIRDAIYYEISREGQAFFVHNRIQNIHEVANLIKKLCPEVKVKVAHGQMDGKQLEEIMMEFIEHDFDVLVSTTIIESGLDIPNANTIIINNAQNFGLSDLHQMRGRVGRSNKKAFCYLLAPPKATLTNEANRRLRALEEFSDLGSGFNIAMRDLDIRGAGDLLGGEQSGFISDIGLETFQKILNEAIKELKENEFKELFADEAKDEDFVEDCQIDTDFETLLPDDYVEHIEERLSLYKELSDLENETQLEAFQNQLIDRFGPIPEQTFRLMDTIRLRWVGKKLGFEKLVIKNQKMICYFIQNPQSDYFQSPFFTKVLAFVQNHPHEVTLAEKFGKLRLSFKNIDSLKFARKRLSALQETYIEESI